MLKTCKIDNTIGIWSTNYYSTSRNNNALVYDVDELFYNLDNRCVVYDVQYELSTVTERLCE